MIHHCVDTLTHQSALRLLSDNANMYDGKSGVAAARPCVGTLRLCGGVSQAQSEFAPGAGKWSICEVLDHLLLAEQFYRRIFVRLIDLQKSGQRPVISLGFGDVNTSIAHIPKAIMPMLPREVPLTIFNMFVPKPVREAMTEFRVLSAQNPDVTTPKKGQACARTAGRAFSASVLKIRPRSSTRIQNSIIASCVTGIH